MKKRVILWGLFLFFNEYLVAESEAYLFSLDYLYPQTYFYRFEAVGKELGGDIDLFLIHQDSLAYAIEHNYLQAQFKKLYASAQMLCSHNNESRNYLRDDIAYLIEIVDIIAEKYAKLIENFDEKNYSLGKELYDMLSSTKDVLIVLLANNGEVVLS